MELYTLLPHINSPEDIKSLDKKQIAELAQEIRKHIIDVVGKNGGHLASNLGVVELTIALHRVFNSPKDAIVWDVSHQSYTHKLLTGRYKDFSSLRQNDGMSGFTRRTESVHDYFDAGHASTSISAALGLLTAWDIQKQDRKVVAVIGDGALTGGMAFEALSNAGQLAKNLIVVLNDNQMSIDQNTGSLSRYLSRLTMSSPYQSFRYSVDSFVSKIPLIGKVLSKFIFRFKRGLKGLLLSNNLFTNFGFEYVGPLNGHDEKELELVFKRVKKMKRPVVVHVLTKKGKGYSLAEDHPERFHGIGPFCISDGQVEKFDTVSFTEAFSNSLMNIAKENEKITCITAAMAKGTGLDSFARHYSERFFDVGIAEEHAVTFAGGLAVGGLIPIICIYSTFIQRSIDQIIHDISLQNVHAVLVLDRAGVVPYDGETHQGIFDISLFRPIPNITILSPASSKDLDLCLNWAVNQNNLVVIRYPKMSCPSEQKEFSLPVELGKGVLLSCSEIVPNLCDPSLTENTRSKILFVTTGGMYSEVLVATRSLALENVYSDIYSLRFIKPLDEKYFLELAAKYDGIVFVEDGIISGGISEYLSCLCAKNGITNFCVKAFSEKFYPNGTRAQICKLAQLSPEDIKKSALSLLKK